MTGDACLVRVRYQPSTAPSAQDLLVSLHKRRFDTPLNSRAPAPSILFGSSLSQKVGVLICQKKELTFRLFLGVNFRLNACLFGSLRRAFHSYCVRVRVKIVP
jgi:hypothetical protein